MHRNDIFRCTVIKKITRRLFYTLLFLVLVFNPRLNAQTIIPEPVKIESKQGTFTFNQETIISFDSDAALNEVQYLAHMFQITSGYVLKTSSKDQVKNFVKMSLDEELSTLGSEGYELDISEVGIII